MGGLRGLRPAIPVDGVGLGAQAVAVAAAARGLMVEVGGRVVAVEVVRSGRRRRTVSFAVVDRGVVVRAPLRVSQREILEMLQLRAAWIGKRLEAVAARPERVFVDGATVPYLGRELPLRVVAGRGRRVGVEFDGEAVVAEVPSASGAAKEADGVRVALERWYRVRAGELFERLVARWSAASGLVPARVLVRSQRSRWGSCGPDGTVRLNWRLVLLEPELAEYVVVHELAHLRHRNHQAGFWGEVESLLPDYRERRRRLTAASRAPVW